VAPTETVQRVVPLMREHGISQVPVVHDDGRVHGILSEGDLLAALTDGRAKMDSAVEKFVDYDFSLVEPGNSVNVLAQLLSQGKVVIVQDEGRLAGIITKIDFIDYVTSRMTA
jgi:cystathionine beta-synthase